jgi:hypothetical protein
MLDRLVEAGVLKPVKFTPNAHRRFRIEDIEALVVAEKEDKTVNYEVPVAPEDELRLSSGPTTSAMPSSQAAPRSPCRSNPLSGASRYG